MTTSSPALCAACRAPVTCTVERCGSELHYCSEEHKHVYLANVRLPQFVHDCPDCTFLGRAVVNRLRYDFYTCPHTFPSMVGCLARWGDDGPNYSSMSLPADAWDAALDAYLKGQERPSMTVPWAPELLECWRVFKALQPTGGLQGVLRILSKHVGEHGNGPRAEAMLMWRLGLVAGVTSRLLEQMPMTHAQHAALSDIRALVYPPSINKQDPAMLLLRAYTDLTHLVHPEGKWPE